MQAALALASATRGAFDPSIAPLVDLWGFGPVPARGAGLPTDLEIAAARARVGWRRLGLDAATGRLTQPGGVALDLSGIAKGYAVDRVAHLLEAAGIVSWLVEIGGELRGQGVKPDDTPWWVAIEQVPGLVVALHGLAVATSGDARRHFTQGGRIFGHTIDPRTGWPIADSLASVTVLHPRCMQADALATALAVLGPGAGMEHAARQGIAALFLLRDARGGLVERRSPAFEAMLA
jgi:thiamine biosynthesis lipoprotein